MGSALQAAGVRAGELRAAMRGQVIVPGDAAYEAARRLHRTGVDRSPAAIIRPEDVGDVARAVTFARSERLDLAVRSGGHSFAGHSMSAGGLTLDMTSLKALHIDRAARTAWAEGGATAGEYTRAMAEHGLATGFGDTPSVGVAGITLGGGVGFLHRLYGMTIDNLLAAEIVTADGDVLYIDGQSHPDLFWAVRGGGGNFGVVTRLKYRLHDVDAVVGGMLMLPATADTVTAVMAEAMAAADGLSGLVNIMTLPPVPTVPPELHGTAVIMLMMVHAGDAAAGERAFAPFRAVARPLMDGVRPMRYPEIFEGEHGPQPPAQVSVNSFFMDTFDRRDAAAVLEWLAAGTAPLRFVQLRVLGGAVARVEADETAFPHRDRQVMALSAALFQDEHDAPAQQAWADGIAAALRQGAGSYVNFLGDEGAARVREAYAGTTWARLRSIKAAYDPDNLFRGNQNIPPA